MKEDGAAASRKWKRAASPPTGRSDGSRKVEFSLFTFAIVLLGAGYFIFGRFNSPASQAALFIPMALLFTSHIRYTSHVEGRPLARLLPYSALLWAGAWAIEASGVWGGLYAYPKSVIGALRLGPVPVLIPSLWLLFCWLAASIVHFLWSPDRGGTKGLTLFREIPATAWVLVSIAFAIEWHFSALLGLWNWTAAGVGWRINGVPAVNFLTWLMVGALSPLLERAGRAPRIRYRTDSLILQALPMIGFGLVLIVNTALNIARGFLAAGALGGASLLILAAALLAKLRRRAQTA